MVRVISQAGSRAHRRLSGAQAVTSIDSQRGEDSKEELAGCAQSSEYRDWDLLLRSSRSFRLLLGHLCFGRARA